MLGLQQLIASEDDMKAIVTSIDAGLKEQLISGLTNSARTVFMASLFKDTKRVQVVITHNLLQAQKLYDDLTSLIGEEQVLLYPVNELISSEIAIASPEMKSQRIDVLNQLVNKFCGIVIIPMAGLRRLLPPQDVWAMSQLRFTVGHDVDIEQLLKKLVALGYTRQDMVTSPGNLVCEVASLIFTHLRKKNPFASSFSIRK